jgi:hypothetical protein
MRRASLLVPIVAVVLVGLVALGRLGLGAGAQEATLTDTEVVAVEGTPPAPQVEGVPAEAASAHPLVGSWLADIDAGDPSDPPALITFRADGTYVQSEIDGVGAWAATGEQTAALTLHSLGPGPDGAAVVVTIRATVEVAADGQSFTAAYTLELTRPDGTSTGEYGPGTATGTRVAVEPMGTPVGTLADLFTQFEAPEGAPGGAGASVVVAAVDETGALLPGAATA